MAEMERKDHTFQEREKLTRLLTIFDTGLGLGLGNDENQPSLHTRRRVTIADTRQSVESNSSSQLTQKVNTFYVDSWPEVQVKDNIIIPNVPASSRSIIGGTPITIETAIELRQVVLGSTVHSFSREWRKSGLMFHDLASAWAYGLQTLRCGSRGLVLCIQGYLLKHLLFAREYTSSLITQNALKPNDFERRRALVSGLCEILWQAGEGKRCCVCLSQEQDCYKSDYKCRADGITEKLHLYEFKKFQDLQIFVKRNLSHFEYENSNGCILFLYSLVFSRTIQKVYEDMDTVPGENRKNKLLTDNEELTISLLNLILTGRAVKYLHNGNVVFDSSGQMLPKTFRGINERSHIGFLFWDKGENDDERTEIGSMLKTPRNPVWVTLVNNQFGLLFSTNKDLVSDWRVEHRFVLHYYTGLSCHAPTALTVDTRFGRRLRAKTAIGRKEEKEKTPPLVECILTKWYGADIKWNDGIIPYV
ncbi:hypothetical protein CHS0354_022347 [Potamilus streckersoni]|uniref:Ubiquitin carboxyl-terminal hydrolase MINDY n=1 Tax=Potamilus streckersoni TaxID=2493646 RepID=A0AAE0T295_9BIVA|nr:hypothetical protein CHS0354_022347 [Potamilus streckersoni]